MWQYLLLGFLSGGILILGGIFIGHYGWTSSSNHINNIQNIIEITPSTSLAYNTDPRDALIDCLHQSITNHSYEDIILPHSPLYFNATQVFSKFYRNFPVAVVYVNEVKTVSNVMKCATIYQVVVTPRCGGHGNAGQSVQTGEITLDVSRMKKVEILKDNTSVIIGAGNTAGTAFYEVYYQSNGTKSIPIGQKPTVGISGLTLGGGFGFSTRLQGFLCDNLISLTAVTGNGSIIFANNITNEDLFWSACGGGGGSFAVIVEFHYRLFTIPQEVVVFHYFMSMTNTTSAIKNINDYQSLSYDFNNKATLNLEVINNTFMSITGFYYGNESEFYSSLSSADPNNYFPSSSWQLEYISLLDAVLKLSGWNTTKPADLLHGFPENRNYYQFKSYLLFDVLPSYAIELLINFVDITTTSGLIFEFQSLGGVDSAFSMIDSQETAFSHRNARHCLMLKSWGQTIEEGDDKFGDMSNMSYELGNYITGEGAYVNHLDYEIWNYLESYYGLATTAVGGWNATIERLIDVNSQFDSDNILRGFQLF